ncbi:MAG: hypothetical protein LUQ52_07470 [Methylococcaceae bacterium]|nr:hypothetical protein [Methylococcaceae bacterium]
MLKQYRRGQAFDLALPGPLDAVGRHQHGFAGQGIETAVGNIVPVHRASLHNKQYAQRAVGTFSNSINTCISDIGTRFKNEMHSLMTMNFQFILKNRNLDAWSIHKIRASRRFLG